MDEPLTLSQARAEIGLKTPSSEAKTLIWNRVQSPTAGIRNGYSPLAGAREAHKADARGVALSGGWRGGKSLYSGMEGLAWIPYAQLIWLIAVDYDTTRQEFAYLAEGAISTGLALPQSVHIPMNRYQPCTLRAINGCIVETRTLSDFRKALTAKPPDLIIVCEPGLIDNLTQVMELLWGRVAEKRGGIILAGTSDESSEEWYQIWEGWNHESPEGGKSFSIATWDNAYRFPKGQDEREFKIYEAKYGHEALMAHYGGIPSAPSNLILKGYWSHEVNVDPSIEFDKSKPVEITIDPGYDSHYVVEVMQWNYDNDRLQMVDEVAEVGLTHDEVRALCEARPWWRYVQGGTIDPYAGENHVYGSIMPVYYWEPVRLRLDYRPRVPTTVQALKEALANGDRGPRLTVSDRCTRFIYEAARWRKDGMNPSKKKCDALKAAGYWLVDHFGQERVLGAHEDEDNVVIGGGPTEFEMV